MLLYILLTWRASSVTVAIYNQQPYISSGNSMATQILGLLESDLQEKFEIVEFQNKTSALQCVN